MKKVHTIQLDKLVFSCISTVNNNFNCQIDENENYKLIERLTYNSTILIRTKDFSNRFKHTYNVFYIGKRIGTVDFNMFGGGFSKELIRFTVFNEVFYNDTLKCLFDVLKDLNLEINNFSKIDIAIDFQNHNVENMLRRAIRNKKNEIKVLNRFKDRDERVREILYENQGSPNNPYEVQTTYIKNKKETLMACVYNKMDEIDLSRKDYILEYHKSFSYKFKSLFRFEIRLKYEEIYRYLDKHPCSISLENLQKPEFLYSLFEHNLSRLIEIYNGIGKKRKKVSLIPPFEQLINNNL